jgi:hypothetical protein
MYVGIRHTLSELDEVDDEAVTLKVFIRNVSLLKYPPGHSHYWVIVVYFSSSRKTSG